MKKLLLPASLALLFLPAGCHRSEPLPETSTPKQQVLQTTVVHYQQMGSQLVLPARVVAIPTSMVHIYPLISGRVLSLRILPGQQVHKNEEIGSLQSSDVSQARSDFEKAKIEATRADLQLSRAKQLLAHDVMAQKDYDDLKAIDDTAHAELERARQALHLLGFKENGTSDVVPIVAPISGIVLDVGTGAGELQRSLDNATPIATLADIHSVWVVGDLYPRDQTLVRVGQPASITVTGYPGLVLHGKVQNISDAVDPVTLTLKVRVVLDNPGYRLKPDMFANMTLTTETHDVVVVPATAVIRNGNENFVFIETSPGKYDRRNVTLGSSESGNDEVTQGLAEGDKVVTTGAELLREAGGQ
jgi:cobalt-zinc-cadmium efflux system membrane fusion protein